MTDTQDTPTPNTEPGGERGDAGPSRRRRKLLPLGIGALIVAGLGVGLWLSYRPVPDQLQGMVDARELRITSKVTGRIADFHVEEGQPVRAGQLLYTLDSPEVEIGWHLHPDVWGRGIATEAATRVLDHAADLPRVVAVTPPDTEPSQRVARRLGMRDEGLTDRYYDTTTRLFVLER